MTILTTTEASGRLDELLDNLAESHEFVQITGQRHSGVLVSEDDWRAIQETLYLTGIPGPGPADSWRGPDDTPS